MDEQTKKEDEDQYQELTICLILKYYLGCYCCCSTPVAPEPVIKKERIQFVGEGFFIEEIFDHMIEKATVLDREEKSRLKKLKSRFKFRAAGKMGRFGAVEAAKKAAARKRKFKSVGKITQLGAIASRNANNTSSIEELPDESQEENKKWNFKALGKLAKVLGIAPPQPIRKGKSFKVVGKATQMGVIASRR